MCITRVCHLESFKIFVVSMGDIRVAPVAEGAAAEPVIPVWAHLVRLGQAVVRQGRCCNSLQKFSLPLLGKKSAQQVGIFPYVRNFLLLPGVIGWGGQIYGSRCSLENFSDSTCASKKKADAPQSGWRIWGRVSEDQTWVSSGG